MLKRMNSLHDHEFAIIAIFVPKFINNNNNRLDYHIMKNNFIYTYTL